ncbi:MAG: sulfatase-like hydrolase/transferase, partial [Bacteroidales bacterium]
MTSMKQWVKNPAVSTKLLLAGAFGLTAVVSGCNSNNKLTPGVQKPNIILIFADDLGYGDLSCNGATRISTPAIDQLAADGINFTNAYASSSICSPSRYSLMTGEYAWRTRLKWGVLKYFDKPLIEQEQTT